MLRACLTFGSSSSLWSFLFLFELIGMSSQTTAEDYIMAWGAFPLVNGDFQINKGKFKVPNSIDRHNAEVARMFLGGEKR